MSGDYYDFILFHSEANAHGKKRTETGVGIALGDISGKGISAALLMATLHSAVRAYRFASEEVLYAATPVEGLTASREEIGDDAGELFQSPGRILSLLNRHLYRSTQPEKYATLFSRALRCGNVVDDLLKRRAAAATGAEPGWQYPAA